MAIEDIFNGAKNAMVLYYAFFNTVAQEIGMERTLALVAKTDETMGVMQGKMMKEQMGIKELDAKTVFPLIKAVYEGFGIVMEVIEESPTAVRFKCLKCPGYPEGLDNKTRESVCRNGGLKFADAILKQLNPNASLKLRKFRSAPDDFCEEEIVLG